MRYIYLIFIFQAYSSFSQFSSIRNYDTFDKLSFLNASIHRDSSYTAAHFSSSPYLNVLVTNVSIRRSEYGVNFIHYTAKLKQANELNHQTTIQFSKKLVENQKGKLTFGAEISRYNYPSIYQTIEFNRTIFGAGVGATFSTQNFFIGATYKNTFWYLPHLYSFQSGTIIKLHPQLSLTPSIVWVHHKTFTEFISNLSIRRKSILANIGYNFAHNEFLVGIATHLKNSFEVGYNLSNNFNKANAGLYINHNVSLLYKIN